MLHLLERIEKDVTKLFTAQGETERTARSAFLRVENVENDLARTKEDLELRISQLRAELEKVGAEAKVSTVSLAEIRGTARIAGVIGGALGSLLVAWILKVLGVE